MQTDCVPAKSLAQVAIETGEQCNHWIGRYYLFCELHKDSKDKEMESYCNDEVSLSLKVAKPIIKEFATSMDSLLSFHSAIEQSIRIKLSTSVELAKRYKAGFNDCWPEIVAILKSLKPVEAIKDESNLWGLRELTNEVLASLEDGITIQEAYPLLRQLEPTLTKRFGETSWPRCLVALDGNRFNIATSRPHLDQFHDGEYSSTHPLNSDDETELKNHLTSVIRSWLREHERLRDKKKDYRELMIDSDSSGIVERVASATEGNKSESNPYEQQGNTSWFRVLECFTGVAMDERIQKIQAIVDSDSTADDKLYAMDAIMQLPRIRSKLAKMLGVKPPAIGKTTWWVKHGKYQQQKKVTDREEALRANGRRYHKEATE